MSPRPFFFLLAATLSSAIGVDTSRAALPSDFESALNAIQTVGAEGAGNVEAAAAWKTLSNADADAILPLLAAMESSSPLARNWLRSAVEVIADRELTAGANLPVNELGAFLLDVRQSPQARRIAFDTIARVDADTAAKLVPGFLNDPSTELRRDAVQSLMDEAKALVAAENPAAAVLIYRQALNAARDVDQIQEIAKQLTGKLDQELDLPRHFGFLMNWNVIGPFDNTGHEGFDTVFPPETEINLEAAYPGKEGKEIKWQPFASTDDYGKIDLNQPFGPLKEVTAYAFTDFNAAQAGPAELRLGCKNAWKIWFNGELVFGRDEYHRGQRIDQYLLPVTLKEGNNTLLVKLCQNEQTETWTAEWEFQLRVCDATGTAILAADRPETPRKEAPRRRGGKDAAQ
ncbi:MAG: hypothetical protein KDN20_18530 [Verrucomicrobiae bacterium]|nr:hypothetical protein [Verrucomicrobiae bacterium]